MIEVNYTLRVRYAETDQMGFVYYGNYAQFLEVGRVELFREIGISYKEIEAKGVLLPVSDYSIEYKNAAKYDDLLCICTKVPTLPQGARIYFDYEIFNQENKSVATAKTTLFFYDKTTQKPIRCPSFILDKMTPFFDKKE